MGCNRYLHRTPPIGPRWAHVAQPDLNLLPALDVLLREGSVAGAARVLGLSDSAMSRTLLRLREATGDALLVRAGRRLVPTPHALALRDRVHALADDARAVLRPTAGTLDLRSLDRVLVLRANEGFVETFAARLVAALAAAAPGVRLRFAPKPDKGVQALRDGAIDLEIGVLGDTGLEVKVQAGRPTDLLPTHPRRTAPSDHRDPRRRHAAGRLGRCRLASRGGAERQRGSVRRRRVPRSPALARAGDAGRERARPWIVAAGSLRFLVGTRTGARGAA